MKRFFYLLLLGIISNFCLAQNAIIKGKILDANMQEPLIGATVYLSNQKGANTGSDGSYQFESEPGAFTLICSYVGYTSQSQTLDLSAGQIIELNFNLSVITGILNTVVVSGSKYEKKIGEETVSIDVINQTLINNTNDVKLDQTLQRMPGVSVIDGQANIRGGSGFSYGAGSRVLILMDDLPVLTGDAAFPSWDFIPIENIEQVEIIKGASSALYGSSALNGIINVRSAYPTSKPVTRFTFFNGMYFSPRDTAQKWWDDDFPFVAGASFAHRQKFGKFDLSTGAYIYNQDSYLKDLYNRRGRANINTRYRINSKTSIGLNVNAQLSRSTSFFFWSGIDSGLYVPYAGTAAFNRGFKITVDPYFNFYDKKGNRHKILTRYYGNHNSTATTAQSNFNDLYYGEYQYQKRFEPISAVFTGGIVGSYTKVVAALYGDTTYTSSNEAAYLQFDKKFGEKLNLSSGMRYEFNQIAGLKESRPVFRLGVNYQAAEYTYLRASWGQGYRFPTIAEKYINTTISLLGIFPNPDLTSETGWSSEIGIKQGIKFSNWQGYVDLSGFVSEYNNMMEFTFGYYPDEGAFFPYGFKSLNIGDTRILGGEISIIGEGKIGTIPTTLIAGYTYIDPKFQVFDSLQNALSSADKNVLKYRFRHTIKFDAESTIHKFRVGVSVNYYSFMEAVDAAFVDPIIPNTEIYIVPGLQQFRDEHNNGDCIMDMRLAFLLNSSSEISLICTNLLNRDYSIRPAMMEAPRNLTLRYAVML